MGNSPSTTKANTPPTTSTSSPSTHDSPRASRRDREPRNLIPIHHHRRSVASPEASVVQAQGSTISNRDSQSRPLSVLNPPSPSNSSTLPRASDSRPRPDDFRNELSEPVAVPSTPHEVSTSHDSQFGESVLISGPGSSSAQDMSYHTSRPPRLPLPIEEEIHTPGSPIVAPTNGNDIGDDVSALDEQSGLPRRTSGLSNATEDDDAEELRVDKTRPTVPTRIEWRQGGQKVYVTGTPFQWSRKQRLLPANGREGILETVIPVFPGTHHIKFLVDGSMQTSPDLPTTVDFGNNLVNYIEVSGEEPTEQGMISEALYPKSDKEAETLPSRQASCAEQEKTPQKKVIVPVETFSDKLPQYLSDFDQPEDSQAYRLASLALEKLPNPPSLPGFLTKPILNNTTLIKDDNSVLNMPNHTVLNHLGTSSIKNNVLAVSATTRYRNKYVTTIIYKPTSD
ncbi:hypothetical protein DL766_003920 [Monosporascus sp. MC13-8B]|uniref:Association with the SNF1 complex (ASC) domain-containing protein n=1 Tax=Monosporascus cannonballus TaxID=155416 RepID=A0ABY0HHF9_9PEZI|nr:hypothetical protein DL762_000986 [Monosporascus cannonballus]RYP32504.1 hypothetical protein DL766_003920 [Monosporascus sp. MC13-8B]